MSITARRLRRLLGLTFLAAAVFLLLAGQTLLHGRLRGALFIIYWLACLGLVVLALITALIDALVIRKETRHQHLDLIRETLGDPPERPRDTTLPHPGNSRDRPGAKS